MTSPLSAVGTRAPTGRGTVPAAAGVAAACLALFLALAVLVARGWLPLVGSEQVVDDSVHSALRHSGGTVDVARAVSAVFDPDVLTPVALVLAVLLLVTRRVRAALYVAVARFGELLVETATKDVVGRARPDLSHPFTSAKGFSFPSGHTGGTAALLVALLVLCTPLLRTGRARLAATAVVVVAVLAVAVSRVLLGAHYPSDTVGGALLGTGIALGGSLLLPVRPPDPTDGAVTSPGASGRPGGRARRG